MKMKLIVLGLVTLACSHRYQNLPGYDLRLFKPVWELAQAVRDQDTVAIEQLVKRKKIDVDYRERVYGQTLLIWAVTYNKYNSAKKLLELGADPNLQCHHSGNSAVMAAAGNDNTDYLKIVMRFGGNPNNVVTKAEIMPIVSPLEAAAFWSLENVKILVEAGADINYGINMGNAPIFSAVFAQQIEVLHYLLIEKDAVFDKPMHIHEDGSKAYITDFMKNWVIPLNDEQYKLKMELVEFLKANGMNY